MAYDPEERWAGVLRTMIPGGIVFVALALYLMNDEGHKREVFETERASALEACLANDVGKCKARLEARHDECAKLAFTASGGSRFSGSTEPSFDRPFYRSCLAEGSE